VTRLLSLVPYLQTVGEAGLDETAERFGVSRKQLLRDLNVIWYCGLPGGYPGDLIEVDFDSVAEGVIRLSNAEFLSRPMRFTPDEAYALLAALQDIRELADAESRAAVDSAIAKLGAVQASGGVAVRARAGSDEVRAALREAVEGRRVVTLVYDAQPGQAATRPTVEPYVIASRDGYGYLQAWSIGAEAWRTYRLDRISAVEATGEMYDWRGQPEPFGAGWLDQRADAALVKLEVKNSAHWITEYFPIVAAKRTRRGWLVTMRVADPAWWRALLLRLGGEVLSVDPPDAAASAREAAREALAAYEALADV
jgi:proteasome accessory factor C